MKLKYLDKSVRVAIATISKLINKTKKSLINLAIILYNLSKKNLEKFKITTITLVDVFDLKKQVFEILVVANSIVDDFILKNIFEKNVSKINIYLENLIERIRQVYFDNEIFKRISTNLIKKNVKLKLENCEINNELF